MMNLVIWKKKDGFEAKNGQHGLRLTHQKNILSKIVVNVGNKEKRRLIKKLDKIQIWKKI